ncbi:hypothetical protein KDA_20640 [Dictyobacter alpinus]|uniref:WXG100 family type VII secretion target n=1 Tax=Dictyobacter alpinus TaxID=2014873 RepID=A0A402B5G8_9CHLR|nr:hypothetical protein [Dictyobacter alpinus]GCE26580.1 hypothetical protein KDA_20640 [Dictyobacter alpinus]
MSSASNTPVTATAAGGSINITDLGGLHYSLNQLLRIQGELQSLIDHDLPMLNNALTASVNGTTVNAYINNYSTWLHAVTSVSSDMQALFNYLNPIVAAVDNTLGY